MRRHNLGPVGEQLNRAIEVMSRPENRRAVLRIAEELMLLGTLDGQDIPVLIDVADGDTTEAEYTQYKMFRAK